VERPPEANLQLSGIHPRQGSIKNGGGGGGHGFVDKEVGQKTAGEEGLLFKERAVRERKSPEEEQRSISDRYS